MFIPTPGDRCIFRNVFRVGVIEKVSGKGWYWVKFEDEAYVRSHRCRKDLIEPHIPAVVPVIIQKTLTTNNQGIESEIVNETQVVIPQTNIHSVCPHDTVEVVASAETATALPTPSDLVTQLKIGSMNVCKLSINSPYYDRKFTNLVNCGIEEVDIICIQEHYPGVSIQIAEHLSAKTNSNWLASKEFKVGKGNAGEYGSFVYRATLPGTSTKVNLLSTEIVSTVEFDMKRSIPVATFDVGGKFLVMANVHLASKPVEAKEELEQLQMVVDKIEEGIKSKYTTGAENDQPIIVICGDFNCDGVDFYADWIEQGHVPLLQPDQYTNWKQDKAFDNIILHCNSVEVIKDAISDVLPRPNILDSKGDILSVKEAKKQFCDHLPIIAALVW